MDTFETYQVATSEICASIDRIFLGTFDTAHEAPLTFDAAAWCLGRLHREIKLRRRANA
jgi:hypothetical protein